jgi:hypothetical protein
LLMSSFCFLLPSFGSESIPGSGITFFSTPQRPVLLWVQAASYPVGTGGCFPGGKSALKSNMGETYLNMSVHTSSWRGDQLLVCARTILPLYFWTRYGILIPVFFGFRLLSFLSCQFVFPLFPILFIYISVLLVYFQVAVYRFPFCISYCLHRLSPS